jgi:MFS family permease
MSRPFRRDAPESARNEKFARNCIRNAVASRFNMTPPATRKDPSQIMFWGCFIALITTSMAFITRAVLVGTTWPEQFGLDAVQSQQLFGAGIWPFAISIILFSLFIDKIGYRFSMFFSYACYVGFGIMALWAYNTVNTVGLEGAALADAQSRAYWILYAGSIILALGNGTVEAFINPIVATLFSKEKTKWLNILHAGWPGGLVLGGLAMIAFATQVADDWRVIIYLLAIPATVYLVMMARAEYPVNERVASGTTYREMLAEFGVLGAALASFLMVAQLGDVFGWSIWVTVVIVAVLVGAYGAYCKSYGRPLIFFLCLIMMPLATTELGTDGAITGLMAEPMMAMDYNPTWVLVYTSLIMMILRFYVGKVVKLFGPLGLLAVCSGLAVVGLYMLSTVGAMFAIFAAATLYGIGKTYFWPTMLGVVAEQSPKGGALTLNAIAGIGMLTVGVIGGPLIGYMQEMSAQKKLENEMPGVYAEVSVTNRYVLGEYTAVSGAKVRELPNAGEVEQVVSSARQGALANVTIFPMIMLAFYIGLIFYFRSRGGYRPVDLTEKRLNEEVLTKHVAEA